MKFGILFEHQLPRPWGKDAEFQLLQDALEQTELADRLGYDYAWATEHHFLEEYAHSSAPEVFLAACSQRTKQIRLGHAVTLTVPQYNHPVRIAERIATLDLVSDGRAEFGTGESASAAELEGFNVDVAAKRAMWLETVGETANLMALDPYPGFSGTYFSMPCRNVVPKPRQRPHPPMWVACSNRNTIALAAKLGLGALTFAFVDYEETEKWVKDYYRIFREECTPVAHTVNPNIAIVTPFTVHPDEEEALRRGLDGFRFFGFANGHHYAYGEHVPGRTNVWANFENARHTFPTEARTRGIGTPAQMRAHMRRFSDIGVDQVIFIHQGGKMQHEHICESLQLFADEVMPEFKAESAQRDQVKAVALAPFVEAAMKRRDITPPLADDEIPTIKSLGRRVAEETGRAKPLADEMRDASGTVLEESGAADRSVEHMDQIQGKTT
jgi:alkanesulfonate monooxygenase SsuD/methylene tetrahydromethanopterin reductase-like flavin-dependent oxidoreductase (luciferase family)